MSTKTTGGRRGGKNALRAQRWNKIGSEGKRFHAEKKREKDMQTCSLCFASKSDGKTISVSGSDKSHVPQKAHANRDNEIQHWGSLCISHFWWYPNKVFKNWAMQVVQTRTVSDAGSVCQTKHVFQVKQLTSPLNSYQIGHDPTKSWHLPRTNQPATKPQKKLLNITINQQWHLRNILVMHVF